MARLQGVVVLLLLLGSGQGAAGDPTTSTSDPGLELVLALSRNELMSKDLRSGEEGPTLLVAVGSPAHPTPRGSFRLGRVIFRPGWRPGLAASEAGARARRSSVNSPMGVAKLPFAENGAIALHGGGEPGVLGKPVSSGCVRAADADLLRLLAWLDLRRGLAPPESRGSGEVVRDLWRPTYLLID